MFCRGWVKPLKVKRLSCCLKNQHACCVQRIKHGFMRTHCFSRYIDKRELSKDKKTVSENNFLTDIQWVNGEFFYIWISQKTNLRVFQTCYRTRFFRADGASY